MNIQVIGMLDKGTPVFGNWSVDEKIGSGAFGTVYKIKREEFGRTYFAAMKVIKIPQDKSEYKRLRSEGMDDESISTYYGQIAEDFIKEIEMLSSLDGITNIVDYKDHIIESCADLGYTIYIKMQLLTPLSNQLVKENGQVNFLPYDEILNLGIDICSALETCEKHNIIHRDIKVDNIFVSSNGDYKLGDFGIAKQLEATQGEMSKKGTLLYMAPEVFRAENYDKTADIYSLGIVLYRLLNKNRAPFFPEYPTPIKFTDKEQANTKRLNGEDFPDISDISGELMNVLKKACAFNPKDRYQSASEFKKALKAVKKAKAETEEEEITAIPVAPAPIVETPVEDDSLEATASAFNDEIPQVDYIPQNEVDETVEEDDLEATASAFNDEIPQVDYIPQNEVDEVVEDDDLEATASAFNDEIPQAEYIPQNEVDEAVTEDDLEATQSEFDNQTPEEIASEDDAVEKKRNGNRISAWGLLTVIVVCFVIGTLTMNQTSGYQPEETKTSIQLAEIDGKDCGEVESLLYNAGIDYYYTDVYSSTYEYGTIIGEGRDGWRDSSYAYTGDTVELLFSCGPADAAWAYGEPDNYDGVVTEDGLFYVELMAEDGSFYRDDANLYTWERLMEVYGSNMVPERQPRDIIDDPMMGDVTLNGKEVYIGYNVGPYWRYDYEIWD